jgi:hypothetical protein
MGEIGAAARILRRGQAWHGGGQDGRRQQSRQPHRR